jgi:hypothetical protein
MAPTHGRGTADALHRQTGYAQTGKIHLCSTSALLSLVSHQIRHDELAGLGQGSAVIASQITVRMPLRGAFQVQGSARRAALQRTSAPLQNTQFGTCFLTGHPFGKRLFWAPWPHKGDRTCHGSCASPKSAQSSRSAGIHTMRSAAPAGSAGSGLGDAMGSASSGGGVDGKLPQSERSGEPSDRLMDDLGDDAAVLAVSCSTASTAEDFGGSTSPGGGEGGRESGILLVALHRVARAAKGADAAPAPFTTVASSSRRAISTSATNWACRACASLSTSDQDKPFTRVELGDPGTGQSLPGGAEARGAWAKPPTKLQLRWPATPPSVERIGIDCLGAGILSACFAALRDCTHTCGLHSLEPSTS